MYKPIHDIMLFTVTTIRLNLQTHAFENTEVNSFLLHGQLHEELIGNCCDGDQIEKAMAMAIGSSISLSCDSSTKRKIMFIHRVG